MISASTINQIKNRIDIIDVIGEFVSLKRRGANHLGLCPFHNEKTPSFSVSSSKQIYKCFGCGRSGSSITFLMEYEKHSYVESLRWLAERYGITIEETQYSQEEVQTQETSNSIAIANAFAVDFFHKRLFTHTEGKQIGITYLKERGMTEESIQNFKIGYCPTSAQNGLASAMQNAQFNKDILLASGLVSEHNGKLLDKYAGRIIFPIIQPQDRAVGFAARSIKEASAQIPKYVNTPQNALYNKSLVLYGLHLARQAIIKQDYAIIVEGYTDVIALYQAGIKNVIASCGTSLTIEHTFLLRKLTKRVVLLFDGDSAGEQATLRSINLLLQQGLEVEVVQLPEGEDPDSFTQGNNLTTVKDFIDQQRQKFIDYQISILGGDLEDIDKKSNAINQIAETLSLFHHAKDIIKRQEFIKHAAKRLEVEVESLNRLVNLHLRKHAYGKEKEHVQIAKSTFENKQAIPLALLTSVKVDSPDYTRNNEEQLVHVLLEHGEKAWDERHNVAEYVLQFLDEKQLWGEIVNSVVCEILHTYKREFQQGTFLKKNDLLYHPEEEIRNLCVRLGKATDSPSKKWEEFIAGFADDEKVGYTKEVNTTLCLLYLRIIRRLIYQNSYTGIEEEHAISAEEKEQAILQAHQHLKTMEQHIAKEMGIVILR